MLWETVLNLSPKRDRLKFKVVDLGGVGRFRTGLRIGVNMSFFNEILTPAFSTSAILKMKKKVFSKYHLRALQVANWGISLVRLPIWLFLVSLLSMDIFIFSFSSKVDDHENLRTDQIQPLLEAVMLASALLLMMLDQIWKGKLGCYMVFINQNLSSQV